MLLVEIATPAAGSSADSDRLSAIAVMFEELVALTASEPTSPPEIPVPTVVGAPVRLPTVALAPPVMVLLTEAPSKAKPSLEAPMPAAIEVIVVESPADTATAFCAVTVTPEIEATWLLPTALLLSAMPTAEPSPAVITPATEMICAAEECSSAAAVWFDADVALGSAA